MKAFAYNALPGRVVFGKGALQHLQREIERIGAKRALVLSTPQQRGQAEDIARSLGERCAGLYDRAVMHVPVETARAAREEAKRLSADCAVAVGGGSTVGLGKAIALESNLPILAIPTTYAGSEMTPIYGLTENGQKRTGRDARVLPKTVIYDPLLTLSLPVPLSITSALNAMAHCVEALYAEDANPVVSLMAEEGIRALGRSLPKLKANPDDIEVRSDLLYGAWLAGAALGAVGMSIHHKLCHTLGGSFNLPHSDVHTVILPHAAAYNRAAAPDAMARAAAALSVSDAPLGIWELEKSLGAPLTLKEIGMKEVDLDRAARLATERPYYNPRPIELGAIRALLDNAFHGRKPAEISGQD